MNIECDNCGREVVDGQSWRALFKLSGASLRCSHCQVHIHQDLHRVKMTLFRAILVATSVSMAPLLLIIGVCSVATGFCVDITEFALRPKTSALGSVLLLLNFMLVFLGMAVPELIRFTSGDKSHLTTEQ